MGLSKAALDFSAGAISIIHGALRRRGVGWGGFVLFKSTVLCFEKELRKIYFLTLNVGKYI